MLVVTRPLWLQASGDVPGNWRVDFARQWLRLTGRSVSDDASGGLPLRIEVPTTVPALPGMETDEGYQLHVGGDGIRLQANTRFGLLRAGSSLLQLLVRVRGEPCLPLVDVDDAPRFPWRGLMLDVARRFLPLVDMLRVLEGMAALKLNVLHLHLTDDQAFRFPSTRLPRLAGAGSGGIHYSVGELQHLVGRAAEQGIRIVPEFDMPGHCASWLVGHPELAAAAPVGGFRRPVAFGVAPLALDPTRERTYALIGDLLADVAAVFPDPCVHIGGDEVHAQAWSTHAHIVAHMRAEGLSDQRALQARFTRRVVDILTGLGRRAIVWDEALPPPLGGSLPAAEGSALPAGVIVQAWRGMAAVHRARAAGHEVICSSPYYLDLNHAASCHYAFDPEGGAAQHESLEDAIADAPGYALAAAAYRRFVAGTRADMTHPAVGADPGRILGGEACMWSELVDAATIDARVFSRLPAVAERLWSPATVTDVDSFYERLQQQRAQLAAVCGIDVDAALPHFLRALGVPEAAREPLAALFAYLEPVKWYARHLGADVLATRARAGTESTGSDDGSSSDRRRPYDAQAALDGVVDHLPPESLPARAFANALRAHRTVENRARLLAAAECFRSGPRLLPALMTAPQLARVSPLIDDLAELATQLVVALDGGDVDAVWLDAVCARTCAELWQPVAHALRQWLQHPTAH